MARLLARLCLAVALVASVVPTRAVSASLPLLVAYFDPGSTMLTTMARAVVAEYVANWRPGEIVRIVGHCDGSEERAGTGLRLSLQRADAIAAALVAAGIPQDRIATAGHGASEPAASAPSGVPEPKNRRVEIWFPD